MFGLSIFNPVVFDSHYSFIKVGCKHTFIHYNYIKTHIYTFKTNKAKYIVEVEEYRQNIFIIKFYRKIDRFCKNKFNVLTNEFNCTRIISTCVRILISILEKNHSASFGFLGSNTISPNFIEKKEDTQRFGIYKAVMENFVGDIVFSHAMDKIHSTYLMINRNNQPEDRFLVIAKQMFEGIFPELENI